MLNLLRTLAPRPTTHQDPDGPVHNDKTHDQKDHLRNRHRSSSSAKARTQATKVLARGAGSDTPRSSVSDSTTLPTYGGRPERHSENS